MTRPHYRAPWGRRSPDGFTPILVFVGFPDDRGLAVTACSAGANTSHAVERRCATKPLPSSRITLVVTEFPPLGLSRLRAHEKKGPHRTDALEIAAAALLEVERILGQLAIDIAHLDAARHALRFHARGDIYGVAPNIVGESRGSDNARGSLAA